MDPAVRIGVVGAGLIGGSIIKAQANDAGARQGLVVYDSDPATRAALAAAGVALAEHPAELAARVDLAIVAVPPALTPAIVTELLTGSATAVVSDAASVKRSVFEAVADRVDAAALARFVPGHPLAGGESRGWQAARPDLLSGAMWALCPAEGRTGLDATLDVIEFITASLGARVLPVRAHDHDVVLAHTSHMPHLVASALMTGVVAESAALRMRLSGGALRDTTRVAAANPELWSEILRDNAANVTVAMDRMIARMRELRDLVAENRTDELERSWRKGARAREELRLVRWNGGEVGGARVECAPSVDALLEIGHRGDLIHRVIERRPELVLEVLS
jgi:prephenate dehydrogenase